MDYKYDIALSFAGEDRIYVDKVAEILRSKNIKVFYDKFEEVDLWGKDLAIHFDFVYRKSSRYFIPFISKHYKEKVWTRHEVKTAISRAIFENEEYILPVRFDDTDLDGIRPTLGFLDLRTTSPEKLSEVIILKLGKEASKPVTQNDQPQGNIYLSLKAHAIPPGRIVGVYLSVDATNTIRENRFFNDPIFKLSKPLEGNADTFHLINMMTQIKFPKKLEFGEQMNVMYLVPLEFVTSLKKLKGQDVELTAIMSTTLGEKFVSNIYKLDDLIAWVEWTFKSE